MDSLNKDIYRFLETINRMTTYIVNQGSHFFSIAIHHLASKQHFFTIEIVVLVKIVGIGSIGVFLCFSNICCYAFLPIMQTSIIKAVPYIDFVFKSFKRINLKFIQTFQHNFCTGISI